MGEVVSVTDMDGGRSLSILAPFAAKLAPGQSVAVDGACLTVRDLAPGTFAVEVGASTLERTIAGRYGPGTAVNLERAVRAGDRMDGHLVQGHVDGLGTFLEKRSSGNTRFLDFVLPGDIHATTIVHGSVALNGVSLTVNNLRDGAVCEVAIIPHSWEHTNFSRLEPGDPVNVEADLIGRYVQRVIAARGETHAS